MSKSDNKMTSNEVAAVLAVAILAILLVTGTLKDLLAWFGGAVLDWLW